MRCELVRGALEGRFKMDDLTATELEAFFAELGGVLETPSPDVAAPYAKLGDERVAARTARQAEWKWARSKPKV